MQKKGENINTTSFNPFFNCFRGQNGAWRSVTPGSANTLTATPTETGAITVPEFTPDPVPNHAV
jgi:hypothetical protein